MEVIDPSDCGLSERNFQDSINVNQFFEDDLFNLSFAGVHDSDPPSRDLWLSAFLLHRQMQQVPGEWYPTVPGRLCLFHTGDHTEFRPGSFWYTVRNGSLQGMPCGVGRTAPEVFADCPGFPNPGFLLMKKPRGL